MKVRSVLFFTCVNTLFCMCLVSVLVCRDAGAQNVQTEQHVREAVDRFGRAYVAADVETLDAMLVDDYVHVNGGSGGVLSREEWLGWIKTRQSALAAGTLVIQTYDVENVEVRMHDDTAVVTGIVRSSWSDNGQPNESAVRFSNVWLLEDGRWKRALFHDSHLPTED